MNKTVVVGDRQSGRTTRAIEGAPKGATYVWCNHQLDYPKQLAKKLGRDDLKIVGPGWLTDRRWVGLELSALRLDHAAREMFTESQWNAYAEALDRVRSHSPTPENPR